MPKKLKKPLQTGTSEERKAQKTARGEEREMEILHGSLPKTSKAREKLKNIGDEEKRKAMERRIKLTVREFKVRDPQKYD